MANFESLIAFGMQTEPKWVAGSLAYKYNYKRKGNNL